MSAGQSISPVFHRHLEPCWKEEINFLVTQSWGIYIDDKPKSTFGLWTRIQDSWHIRDGMWGVYFLRQFSLLTHMKWNSQETHTSVACVSLRCKCSYVSECPVWACQNNLTKPVLKIVMCGGGREGLEPNVLVTSWEQAVLRDLCSTNPNEKAFRNTNCVSLNATTHFQAILSAVSKHIMTTYSLSKIPECVIKYP